eukprot:scaffold15316_cov67-Attheya_sp.AAC.2
MDTCREAVTNMCIDVIDSIIQAKESSNSIDVFLSQESEIENKIFLPYYDCSDTSSKLAFGRGGAGSGIFVYAVLNWGSDKQARWTQYLDMGGNADVRVTQQIMEDFLAGRNNNYN